MKKLFFIFIILLLAVGLGFLIQQDAGYVLIAYNHWTIETSLWVAIVATVMLFAVLYLIIRLFSHTRALGGKMSSWTQSRSRSRAAQLTHQGLCELAEGYWKKAEQNLLKAAKLNRQPLIHYLAAARAAQGLNQGERRDQHLRTAARTTQGADMAIGLTQAELQIAAQQWEQALATLMHLAQLKPDHPCTLNLLSQVYLQLHEWEKLQQLLPLLRKNKVMSGSEIDQLQCQLYLAQIANAPNLAAGEHLWSTLPNHLRELADLSTAQAQHLVKYHQIEAAAKLIENTLKKHWHSGLILLYGSLKTSDTARRLALAESWLKKYPRDADLLLCLGKLSLQEQFLGKAQHYLETSLAATPQADTFFILGQVHEALDHPDKAKQYYRDGLKHRIGFSL